MEKELIAIENFLKSILITIETLVEYDQENPYLSIYINEMWEKTEKWLKLKPCEVKIQYLVKRVSRIIETRKKSFKNRTNVPEWFYELMSQEN